MGQKLIYYRGNDKNIRIGWKFEIGKGKSGYLSERIDGNNKYKDLVAESFLTSDQLNDVNYSNF